MASRWTLPTVPIFVTNTGANNVSVINGSSGRVVKWIYVGGSPTGITYNPGDDRIYVANTGTDNLTVINATSYSVTAHIPVGKGPDSVTYDDMNGTLDVANTYSDNVTWINGSTGRVLGSFPAGLTPDAVFFDAAANQVYVSNLGSDSLTVSAPLTQSLSMTGPVGPTVTDVGVPVAWSSNASGGVAPLHFTWEFGDQLSQNTTAGSVEHVYRAPAGPP